MRAAAFEQAGMQLSEGEQNEAYEPGSVVASSDSGSDLESLSDSKVSELCGDAAELEVASVEAAGGGSGNEMELDDESTHKIGIEFGDLLPT